MDKEATIQISITDCNAEDCMFYNPNGVFKCKRPQLNINFTQMICNSYEPYKPTGPIEEVTE